MSAHDLRRQAAQLRATAERIERERQMRRHALLKTVDRAAAMDWALRVKVQRFEREAAQIEVDIADIRRQEREQFGSVA